MVPSGEELNNPNDGYVNQLVDFGAKRLAPYAENIAVMGTGNHENSLLKNMDVNILKLLKSNFVAAGVKRPPLMVGYAGFIMVRFALNNTVRGVCNIYFHHGKGGGAPVSRAAITSHRRQTFISGMDFILQGHIHVADFSSYTAWELSKQGRVRERHTIHLTTPGYQMGYDIGSNTWASMKEFPPSQNGCAVLELTFGDKSKHERGRNGRARKLFDHNYQFRFD